MNGTYQLPLSLLEEKFLYNSLIMEENSPERYDANLFRHKGYTFAKSMVSPEYIDSLQDLEIRDNDVFQIAYPKSGTVWMQQILSLIYFDNYRNGTENTTNVDRVPWLDIYMSNEDYTKRASPRLFACHLSHSLVPRDVKNKRIKVIYLVRNPKDVMISFYHFEKIFTHIKTSPDLDHFMKRYLDGAVVGGTWFEHIKGWYSHREDFNLLWISYEELIMDLRSVVQKLCQFLGKHLDEQEIAKVIEKAKFKNMKTDPKANALPDNLIGKDKTLFFRKGTIGDWKNIMTVAQSEMFDKIYQEKMKDLPIKIVWDLN